MPQITDISEQYPRLIVRCTISGHTFDFNDDLGAVAIGKGAACTSCMDKMFREKDALRPNGDQPFKVARKKHTPFRHRQK